MHEAEFFSRLWEKFYGEIQEQVEAEGRRRVSLVE